VLFDRVFSLTLVLCLGCTFVPDSVAASLAYSTYLKDGFTPNAMVSDAQGNLYLAGQAVTDPLSGATSAVAVKVDSHASKFLYFVYLDGAGSGTASAITVDSAGNAYIAGTTANPNFPATGGRLGTLPTGPEDSRTFVTKLSPDGAVIFSVLVGGSASSFAEAIALTPQGQILISGMSTSNGFPVTAGAYMVADSNQRPFLMEMDAAAATMTFSATGIGGTSIVLDASGNIYVSGSTLLLDYPTTPGAYQTTFTPSYICSGLCQVGIPGLQQYLSKVNPTGSRLIYSTGINDPTPYRSASTANTGLVVDVAGNAYVTGVLSGGPYPFTTAPPNNSPFQFGFLTKLDPAGAKVLYSIPIGGGGIQMDSSGAIYAAGTVTAFNPGFSPPSTPVAVASALAWLPPQCLPDNIAANSEVYVTKLDSASGDVLDTQWIDGSALAASTLAMASGRVWITGATQLVDVPITPGAMLPGNLVRGVLPGAFLSAVDFSQSSGSTNGGPRLACVVDGGNLMHAGPVAANQLLTLFGVNLGPVKGVSAPDGFDSSIAGVTVTFDGNPAQLLYVSSSQINVLTPAGIAQNATTVMQVAVNGVTSSPRELPVVISNPNLFADLSENGSTCLGDTQGLTLMATNADGSRNSCANPAKLASVVSFYVHGLESTSCFCFDVSFGVGSAALVSVMPVNTFVARVDVQLPSSFATASISGSPEGAFEVSMRLRQTPVGPLELPNINVVRVRGALTVWATQ
jgi:uncharacterized protein (TIGR03437 family)